MTGFRKEKVWIVKHGKATPQAFLEGVVNYDNVMKKGFRGIAKEVTARVIAANNVVEGLKQIEKDGWINNLSIKRKKQFETSCMFESKLYRNTIFRVGMLINTGNGCPECSNFGCFTVIAKDRDSDYLYAQEYFKDQFDFIDNFTVPYIWNEVNRRK